LGTVAVAAGQKHPTSLIVVEKETTIQNSQCEDQV